MSYNPESLVSCRLALSPAMLFNNLWYSNGQLVYTRRNAAVVVDAASVLAGGDPQILDHKNRALARYIQVPIRSGWMAYESRQFVIHGEPLLVLAAAGGVQVLDSEQRTIYTWQFPPNESFDSRADIHHCRGLALVTTGDGVPCIVSGSSNGNLHVIAVEGKRKFRHATSYSCGRESITCVGGEVGSGSGPTFAVGDRAGRVLVLRLPRAGQVDTVCTINFADPIVFCGIRNRAIAIGTYNGVVSLFEEQPLGARKYAELATSTRMLSCVAMHPSRDWIVTGGEDSVIMVWKMPRPTDRNVELLLSTPWRGCPVAGVAFFGDHVVAVPYDQEEAIVFKCG